MQAARLAQEVEAGDAVHLEVGEHHVEGLLAQRFQGLTATVDHRALVVLQLEGVLEALGVGDIVVHDQDASGAGFGHAGSSTALRAPVTS
jgi:hypothetical protein